MSGRLARNEAFFGGGGGGGRDNGGGQPGRGDGKSGYGGSSASSGRMGGGAQRVPVHSRGVVQAGAPRGGERVEVRHGVGSNKSVDAALRGARQTGTLELGGRGLQALPPSTFDIGSVPLQGDGAWWETRETIERLRAAGNDITQLPDDLRALPELKELDLSRNKLSSLPDCTVWDELLELVSLRVDNNALQELPVGFGAQGVPPLALLSVHHNKLRTLCIDGLLSLEECDASQNDIAELPVGLSALSRLRVLRVAANRIKSLPVDFVASPPPLLAEVDLSENSMAELHLCAPSLQVLRAANNKLTHVRLTGCSGLRELILPHNGLTQIPEGTAALPALTTAELSNNKISLLPPELATRTSLQRLDVTNNELRAVPPELGTMSQLTHLLLQGNPLKTMPLALISGPNSKLLAYLRSRLPQFDDAHAHARAATAGGTGVVGGSSNLAALLTNSGTELSLADRKLGLLPEETFEIQSLMKLDASSNAISAIQDEISSLSSLTSLNLSANSLRSLPDAICACTSLAILDVSQNGISALPAGFGELRSLRQLSAHHNGLASLPVSLWAIPGLSHLNVCANALTTPALQLPPDGTPNTVPPLQHLDLGDNKLRMLPPIGGLTSLRELHLQNNQIEMLPPDQLVPLQQLQLLDLRDNNVSNLPPELSRVPSLQHLSLSGNPLRPVPFSVQQKGTGAVLALLARRCEP